MKKYQVSPLSLGHSVALALYQQQFSTKHSNCAPQVIIQMEIITIRLFFQETALKSSDHASPQISLILFSSTKSAPQCLYMTRWRNFVHGRPPAFPSNLIQILSMVDTSKFQFVPTPCHVNLHLSILGNCCLFAPISLKNLFICSFPFTSSSLFISCDDTTKYLKSFQLLFIWFFLVSVIVQNHTMLWARRE